MSLPTNLSSNGRVSELVALITHTAKTIESHYLQSLAPYVPSLDDVTPHLLDSKIWPSELRDAVQVLEGACAQLSLTVSRPNHTILNKAMQSFECSCLNVATKFNIADILLDKPSGIHIVALAHKAGVNSEKLGRIMRLLASKHVFREVSSNHFANNRLSLELLSSNSLANMVSHITDVVFKASTELTDVMTDPHWGNSQAMDRSSWNRYTDYPGTIYQYFEEKADDGIRFSLGMRGWNEAMQATAVLEDFPWSTLPSGTTVCDVGSGIGSMAMELIKAYPNLNLKLQDLPNRIHQAESEVWPKECPAALAENRVEFKPMDFFAESPIEDCDIYYLQNIIHNWPDKECVQILRNIRTVLKPGGRILLHDFVLQHVNRAKDASESAFKRTEAPEPLLPNYGLGRIKQYNADLCMMVLLNSRERTLEEFVDLGKQAGLRFVKLWNAGEMGVVEFQ